MPEVTVLMPVYNAEKHLAKAVESILNQTHRDFEFLIIDDCSTDRTPDILDGYSDSRLVRLRNDPNMGITRTLNRGLEVARGEYIARMDSDDISYPDRLEHQVAHMKAHPEIGLLGTRYVIVDEVGNSIYGEPSPPESGSESYISWTLLWMTSIQHPTAMMRRSLLEKHSLRYDADYETAEDYELWTQIRCHSKVERLWETGLDYRVSEQGISQTRREKQIDTHHRIMHREICNFLGEALPTSITRYLLEMFVPGIPQSDVEVDIIAATDTLLRIRDRFAHTHTLTQSERQQIDHHILRFLHKGLHRSRRESQPSKTLWHLRRTILRESPYEFLRLSRAFVASRVNRGRSKT